jgi:hypothetical protein
VIGKRIAVQRGGVAQSIQHRFGANIHERKPDESSALDRRPENISFPLT